MKSIKQCSAEKEIVEDLIIKGKGNSGNSAYDVINGYYEFLDNRAGSDEYNGLFGPEASKKVEAYKWIEKYSKDHALV